MTPRHPAAARHPIVSPPASSGMAMLGLLALLVLPACSCCQLPNNRPQGSPPDASHFSFHQVEVPDQGSWEVCRAGPPAAASARPPRPVLLLHDVRGLTARPLHYALRLTGGNDGGAPTAADADSHVVYMPVMFGRYGGGRPGSDWNCRQRDGYGPVADDIRAVIDWVAARHPDRGLVVIGNCLSGPAAIESLAHPRVAGAVACQPALPYPSLNHRSRHHLAVAGATLDAAAARARELGGVRLLGFQYVRDFASHRQRFEILHQHFGPGFHGHQLVRRGNESRVAPHFTSIHAASNSGHTTALKHAQPGPGSVQAEVEQAIAEWLGTLPD